MAYSGLFGGDGWYIKPNPPFDEELPQEVEIVVPPADSKIAVLVRSAHQICDVLLASGINLWIFYHDADLCVWLLLHFINLLLKIFDLQVYKSFEKKVNYLLF
jgi:hypothetical protein